MKKAAKISPKKKAELDARMLAVMSGMNRLIERLPEVLTPEELAGCSKQQKKMVNAS